MLKKKRLFRNLQLTSRILRPFVTPSVVRKHFQTEVLKIASYSRGSLILFSSTSGANFDLFAKTEIQIKKAISFTTFQCCHSLLNHKSSVMTDFVCFAGMSWGGRAEEACGVCWAMTDVGRTLKCILHRLPPPVMVCFRLETVAADRWLCGRMHAGTPAYVWCSSHLGLLNGACIHSWHLWMRVMLGVK